MENPLITYYRLKQTAISFHQVAESTIQALRNLGLSVEVKDYHFDADILQDIQKKKRNNVALLHPLFYFSEWKGVSYGDILNALSSAHSSIWGIEVADSTSIAPQFVEWANHPLIQGFFVPSEFSLDSFLKSGVQKQTSIFPHGINEVKSSAKFDFLKKEKKKVVLSFLMGDPWRKGWDYIEPLIAEHPECLFVIKTNEDPQKPGLVREGNLLLIKEWLNEEDKASIYENSDIYLSPHRGGAFELNCLEALAHGLVVIATAFGGVMEYLTDENSLLLKDFDWVKRPGDLHSGSYANLKSDVLSEALMRAMIQYPTLKLKALSASQKIRQKYSWKKLTSEFLKDLEIPL